MTGADAGHAAVAAFLGRVFNVLNGHCFQPVGPVLVFDVHSDGTAQGAPVPDAGPDPGVVLFNEHPPTAAVPFLAAAQVDIYVLLA